MNIAVLLFDNFETLDVYGPVEVFGRLTDLYTLRFYSLAGGQVRNQHGVIVQTESLESLSVEQEVFLIPGGIGTRKEIENSQLVDKIREISGLSKYVLTVCTGSALLARTGLLDNRNATSNKRVFAWATINGPKVLWNKKARWVVDGKFYTSSSVSAGIDMSLGFLSDRHGIEFARNLAVEMEYHWTEDQDNDTFSADRHAT
jgi:putative intracellular protease/amidase